MLTFVDCLSKNIHLGGFFKFVEISGFLRICCFLKVLHTLMTLKLQKNFFYNFLKNNTMITFVAMYD